MCAIGEKGHDKMKSTNTLDCQDVVFKLLLRNGKNQEKSGTRLVRGQENFITT